MKDSYINNLLPLYGNEPVHYHHSDTADQTSIMPMKARYRILAEEEQFKPEQRTSYTEVKISINPAYRKRSNTSDEPVISEQESKYLNLNITSQYLPLAEEQRFKTENGTYFTENAANCKFEETFGENLRYIQSYKLDEALPYMEKLQLYSDPVPNNLSHKELQGRRSLFRT